MDRFVVRTKKPAALEVETTPSLTVTLSIQPQQEATEDAEADSQQLAEGTEDWLMEEDTSDDKSDESSTATFARPKREKQSFRRAWMENRPWLVSKNGQSYCKVCHKSLTNNVCHIKRHSRNKEHTSKLTFLANQPLIDETPRHNQFQKRKNKLKTAELRILMFLLEHNLPFNLMSPLISLIQSVASDSSLVKSLKCARTKATSVTNHALHDEGAKDVAVHLRKSKFSIIIDETTDISTKKCLAVVARFFDADASVVRDRFLSLIELSSGDAEHIHDTIVTLFRQLDIPMSNLVGFASDNASVMVGRFNGVQALLKASNPGMFVMGCVCHSIHLCSAAAAKKIPLHVEKLARNIYNYFCHSAKRIKEFEDLQLLYNVKPTKLLRTSATRWLSLEAVINRILDKWSALNRYFLVCEVEDENGDIGKAISTGLNAEAHAYFGFLRYVLGITNRFNLTFQSERPLVHTMIAATRTFLKTMMSNILKPEVLKLYNKQLHRVDFENYANLVSDTNVYIGPDAEAIIVELPEEKAIEVRKSCRAYYIELCNQVLNRINLEDPALKVLLNVDPKQMGPSIAPLANAFPALLDEMSLGALDVEWRSVVQQEFVSHDLDVERFWAEVFEQKNALNENMFPLLKRFVGAVLSLPHSSACAERIFSKVSIIKNKLRNQLDVPTVNSIMLAAGLLHDVEAHAWVPSKHLVEKYHKY